MNLRVCEGCEGEGVLEEDFNRRGRGYSKLCKACEEDAGDVERTRLAQLAAELPMAPTLPEIGGFYFNPETLTVAELRRAQDVFTSHLGAVELDTVLGILEGVATVTLSERTTP